MAGDRAQAGAGHADRPLPDLRGAGRAYWQAGLDGTLKVPLCRSCGDHFWYPRWHCPGCGSADLDLVAVRGTGRIHTFTVVRRSDHPYFAARVPYVVAMVELDEGPRLMTNLVDCDVDAVRCDMPVRVIFEAREGISVPLFRPA